MKKTTLLVLAFIFSGFVYSQQLPQLTQFMDNSYVINPAFAGMEDFYQVRTSIRNQWTGITDAPSTTILSIYGKQEENIGLGGVIFNDQYGHTSRAGGAVSYAYHLAVSEKIKLSLAISGGFTQFKIDKNGWNVANPNDPLTQGDVIVETVPDATFGFNFYSEKWYLGVSIPQLLSSNLNLLDNNFAETLSGEQTGSLSNHMYIMGSYKISGHVRVYQYGSGSGQWTQIGLDIDGEAADDLSGYSVSISGDGGVVAVAAKENDGSALDAGHVRVYELSGTSWVQLGADIVGEAANDRSGAVSINAAGDRVAIGAPYNNGNGSWSGHVRIYEFNGTSWAEQNNLGTARKQLAGAGLNYFQGRQQKKDGETLAQEGRDNLLGTAGPTDELLASVDEQKRLAKRAGDLGQERLDQSVTGLLDALFDILPDGNSGDEEMSIFP